MNKHLFYLLLILITTWGCTPSGENSNSDFGIVPGSGGSDRNTTNTPSPRLISFSGDNQTTHIGATTTPLKVLAVTAAGEPIANLPISFTVMGNDPSKGSVSPSSALTDANGLAETNYTDGSYIGSVAIQALGPVGTTTFSLTVTGATGFTLTKHPVSSGDAQSGVIGTTVGLPLKVVLKNANGDPVPNVVVRFLALGSIPGQFSGSNSADVTTDANGVAASPTYTLSTQSGNNLIRAQLTVDSSVNTDFSLTGTVPINSPISASLSSIEFSQTSVVADGLNVVDVTLKIRDVYGNLIPNTTYAAGITTIFSQVPSAPSPLIGGSYNNTWAYDSIGTYKRSFTVSNTAGTLTMTAASINSVALTSAMPTINFVSYGPFNPSMSSLAVTTDPLTADGISTTTAVVTLKDTYGNAVATPGQTIVLSTSAGTLQGSMVYHTATGTYRQVLQAPTTVGGGTLTVSLVSINGSSPGAITKSVVLKGGAFSLASSNFTVSATTLAISPYETAILSLTLRDVYNNPLLLTGATVAFTKTYLTGSNGNITAQSAINDLGNGIYQATILPANNTGYYPACPCVDQWVATVTHPEINSGSPTVIGPTLRTQYGVARPTPTASASVYTLDTSYAPADNGASYISGTITLRGAGNEILMVGGFASNIAVSTNFGATVSSITDNNNGTYSFRVHSTSTPQAGTLSITYSGTNIAASPGTISFYGSPSLAQSSFALSLSDLAGAGTSGATLRIKDSAGNDIPTSALAASDVRFVITGNGSMQASVVKLSSGGMTTFTQTYERAATPDFTPNESVTLTAQIYLAGAWNSVTQTRTITIQPPNLAGITIDCDNIDSYRDKHLYIKSGTLRLVNWNNGSILQTSQCAAYAPANPFRFASLTIDAGGIVKTLDPIVQPNPIVVSGIDMELTGNLEIKSTGLIDVSGQGYPGGYNPDAAGLPITSATNNLAGGGGHGNSGQNQDGSLFNNSYGDRANPLLPGMGSYDGYCRNAGATCGKGGGLLRIKMSNVINNGSIKANGTWGYDPYGRSFGGAGGGIKLDFSGTYSGIGDIQAEGGGEITGPLTAAGSGGRVAMIGNSSNLKLENFKVGGKLSRVRPSLPGTVYFSQAVSGTQKLIGSWEFGPRSTNSRIILSSDVDLILESNSRVSFNETINIRSLTIKDLSILTHSPVSATTLPKLNITASNFIDIQLGGKVDVSMKGYLGAYTHSLPPSAIYGAGPTSPTDLTALGHTRNISTYSPGANHFTAGGNNPNFTWGNPLNPTTHGGGGIISGPWIFPCTNGGGVIILTTDQFILDGTINAGTFEAGAVACSGAAGGSINISAQAMSSPAGTSLIKANGQNGDIYQSGYSYSGGAGGLINITSPTISDGVDTRTYALKGLKGDPVVTDGSPGKVTINGVDVPQ